MHVARRNYQLVILILINIDMVDNLSNVDGISTYFFFHVSN